MRAREVAAHVNEFIRLRVRLDAGASLGASELRAAYEDWCASGAHEPLSQQKLGNVLRQFGLAKWKSCGLIRYRDVQLAESEEFRRAATARAEAPDPEARLAAAGY